MLALCGIQESRLKRQAQLEPLLTAGLVIRGGGSFMQTDFEVAEIAFRVDIILISRGPTRGGKNKVGAE